MGLAGLQAGWQGYRRAKTYYQPRLISSIHPHQEPRASRCRRMCGSLATCKRPWPWRGYASVASARSVHDGLMAIQSNGALDSTLDLAFSQTSNAPRTRYQLFPAGWYAPAKWAPPKTFPPAADITVHLPNRSAEGSCSSVDGYCYYGTRTHACTRVHAACYRRASLLKGTK